VIFEPVVPSDCTCVWLRVTGDQPGFVLHQPSSTCPAAGVGSTPHRTLRWYQPALPVPMWNPEEQERGAEE
jgi:hypothetical protein